MWISIFLAVVGLILLIAVMGSHRAGRGWRTMAFVAFCALPVVFAATTIQANLNHMKRVQFCGSCHVMNNHVASLTYDDDEPLASVHFRNNYVEQDHACYACHVSYAMFGPAKAKMNGMRHVWAYVTKKDHSKIELYQPYSNDNCLHCHGSSQRFREVEDHMDEDNFLARVESGELSCLSSGCHDEGHYWDGKYDSGETDDESWDETPADTSAAPAESTEVENENSD